MSKSTWLPILISGLIGPTMSIGLCSKILLFLDSGFATHLGWLVAGTKMILEVLTVL